jgi:CRP-like cAMP-binding protein
MSELVATLRKVEFLAPLDEPTLLELAHGCRVERYAAGARIVSELEFGADVFVLLKGQAEVSVEPRRGERQVLGVLEPGSALGEMSSLTGELRSATVTARDAVEVLRIPDPTFDELRVRRPEVAVAMVRMLGRRLADAERSLDELLAERIESPPTGPVERRRGSISRAWRELVLGRGKDLAFVALAAFVLTLLLVRGLVFVSFRFDFAPREVLRAAYLSGFMLLIGSACVSLLTFRPGYRRAIAIFYGVACALILNELGVTLAFDIFYKDIHTPDPSVAFDVERLYRRTEAARAIVIALVVLVQAAYLRRFYRRVAFVLATRLRRIAPR